MSVKTKSKLQLASLLVFGLLIGVGVHSYWDIIHPAQSDFSSQKWQKLLSRTPANEKLKGKVNPNFEISVEQPPAESIRPGLPFTVTASVTAYRDVSNVQFRWLLRQNLDYVSGNIEPTMWSLQAGDTVNLVLTVQRIDESPSLIHLEAATTEEGVKLGAVGSLSLETPDEKTTAQQDLQIQKAKLLQSEGFKDRISQ